jgi:5-methylcytosine-specific restriction endonuclease McrA
MPIRPKKHRRRIPRVSAARRGYGHAWRKQRMMYLSEHPICENPFGFPHHVVAATDVDHIIAKRYGGPDSFDNYQSLCHRCHSIKTRLEMSGMIMVSWHGNESIQKVKTILHQHGNKMMEGGGKKL